MANRNYETLYIVRPNLTDEEITKITDRFSKVVTDQGGTVTKHEKWEKRKLAYEIADLKEGNYIIMLFSAPAPAPAELNRLMRISDDVIRHTILKEEELKGVALEAANKAAAAATPVEA